MSGQPNDYGFVHGARRVFIVASDIEEAAAEFMRQFGYFPPLHDVEIRVGD